MQHAALVGMVHGPDHADHPLDLRPRSTPFNASHTVNLVNS